MSDIKEAVRDGLANHTGEFANPWIFKGSYSHELLADILNDIMASERLFKNIEALIQEQVRLARIDERNEIALDNYRGHTFSDLTNYEAKFAKLISNNEKRIKELKK